MARKRQPKRGRSKGNADPEEVSASDTGSGPSNELKTETNSEQIHTPINDTSESSADQMQKVCRRSSKRFSNGSNLDENSEIIIKKGLMIHSKEETNSEQMHASIYDHSESSGDQKLKACKRSSKRIGNGSNLDENSEIITMKGLKSQSEENANFEKNNAPINETSGSSGDQKMKVNRRSSNRISNGLNLGENSEIITKKGLKMNSEEDTNSEQIDIPINDTFNSSDDQKLKVCRRSSRKVVNEANLEIHSEIHSEIITKKGLEIHSGENKAVTISQSFDLSREDSHELSGIEQSYVIEAQKQKEGESITCNEIEVGKQKLDINESNPRTEVESEKQTINSNESSSSTEIEAEKLIVDSKSSVPRTEIAKTQALNSIPNIELEAETQPIGSNELIPCTEMESEKQSLNIKESISNIEMEAEKQIMDKKKSLPSTEMTKKQALDSNVSIQSTEYEAEKPLIDINESIPVNNLELGFQSISEANELNSLNNESRFNTNAVSNGETNGHHSNVSSTVPVIEMNIDKISQPNMGTNEANDETSKAENNEPSRRSSRKRKLSWKVVEAAKKPRKFSKYEVTTTRLLAAASGVYCDKATDSFDNNDQSVQVLPDTFEESVERTQEDHDQEDNDNIVVLENDIVERNAFTDSIMESENQENEGEMNIVRNRIQRRKLSQGIKGKSAETKIINNRNFFAHKNQTTREVKQTTPVKSIRRCGGKLIKKLTEDELDLKKFFRRDTPEKSNSDALTPPPSPSSDNVPVIHGKLPETAVVVGFIKNGKMQFLVTNRPLGEQQIQDGNLKGKLGKIAKENLRNKVSNTTKNSHKTTKSVSGIENDDPEKNIEKMVSKTSRLGRKIQPSVRLQDLGSWQNKDKTENKVPISPKKKKIPTVVDLKLEKDSKNDSTTSHGPRGAIKRRTSIKERKVLKKSKESPQRPRKAFKSRASVKARELLKFYDYQQSVQKFTHEKPRSPYTSPKKIDIDSLLAKAPSKSILKKSIDNSYPPREFDRNIEGAVSPERNGLECPSGFKLNIGSLIKSPKKSTKISLKSKSVKSINLMSSNVTPNITPNIYPDRINDVTTPDIDDQIWSNLSSTLNDVSNVQSEGLASHHGQQSLLSVDYITNLSVSSENLQEQCDQLVTGGNPVSDDDDDDRHESMVIDSPEHIQELSSITPEDVADTLGVTSGDTNPVSSEAMLSSELFSEPLHMESSPHRFDDNEPLTPPESSGESSPPCGGEPSGEEPLFGPLKMVMPNGKVSIDLDPLLCEDSTTNDILDNSGALAGRAPSITNDDGPTTSAEGESTDMVPSTSSSSIDNAGKNAAPNWFLLPPSKNFVPDPTMIASMLPAIYGPAIKVDKWPTTPHLDIAENALSGDENEEPSNTTNAECNANNDKQNNQAPMAPPLVPSRSTGQENDDGEDSAEAPRKRKSVKWLDLQPGAGPPPRQRRISSSGREIMKRNCDCCGESGLGHHLKEKNNPSALQLCKKEGGTQMKIKNEPYIIVHQRFERQQWKPLKNGEQRNKSSRKRPSRSKSYCRNSKELLSETSEGETENETTVTTSNGRIVKKKKNCTCPDCTMVTKVTGKSKRKNYRALLAKRKLEKYSLLDYDSQDGSGPLAGKKSSKEKRLSREAALQKLKRALSRKPLWEIKAEEAHGVNFDLLKEQVKRRGRPPGSGKRGPGRPPGSSSKREMINFHSLFGGDSDFTDFTDAGAISDSEDDHTFSLGGYDEIESEDNEADSLSSTIKRVKSSLSTSQVNVKIKVSSSSAPFLNKRIKLSSSMRPHKCIYCEKGFRSLTGLQNHTFIHTGEKPFNCTECEFSAARKGVLMRHMKGVHSEEKPYTCNICDFRCNQSGTLVRHRLTHTDERQFSCPSCPNKFNLKAHLKQHLLTHTGITPYSCPYCEATFKSLSNMRAHTRTHTGEKPYSCSVCDYRSAQKSHLNRHMVTHTQEKPFLCGECGYRCSLKHQLKSHVQNNHTKEANFACDQCSYRAKSATLLKDHKMFHTGDYPFECFDCDYRCSKASVFKKHLLIHGDVNPFVCPECGYEFKRKDNLKMHMKKIHGINESGYGQFKCPECAANFTQKSHLTRHVKTHQPQVPHMCDECGQCYIQLRQLKQHKLKHKIQRATENFPRPEDSPGINLASMSPASYMTLPEEGGSVRVPPSPAISYMTSPEYEQYELDIDASTIRHDFPTGEYPYECSQCYFGCDNEGDLMTHMLDHIEMFECAQCDYRCSTQDDLQLHMADCHSINEFYTLQSPGHNDGVTLHPLLPVFPGEGILLDL